MEILKKRKVVTAILIILMPIYRIVCSIYWLMVKIIVSFLSKTGLHLITVGEIKGSAEKKRSLYREDMVVKTIPLFYEFRDKSCLDLACNDGFWSFRFGRFGAKSFTGVDRNIDSIKRANFLKTVYSFPHYQFEKQDIFNFLERAQDSYDLVLLFGVLYHLPEMSDWNNFFDRLSKINNECLIVDSRWFENEDYWYDSSSTEHAVIKEKTRVLKKWRPKRAEIIKKMEENGYELVIEVNPSELLADKNEALGDSNPYTLENVSDYLTNNRSFLIGYKDQKYLPEIARMLSSANILAKKVGGIGCTEEEGGERNDGEFTNIVSRTYQVNIVG